MTSMPAHVVHVVPPADAVRAIDVIILAFVTDPAGRWSWPDAHAYLSAMPRMVRAFGGRAFEHGSAWCVEDYAGAALWLPPEVHPDEDELGALMQQTLRPGQGDDSAALFEQMGRYHRRSRTGTCRSSASIRGSRVAAAATR
jgi:hypothetical protein